MAKFQPGQSGNPGGRPKGSVTSLWRHLNAEVDAEEDGRTRAEVLYHRAYGEAKRGNIHAIALILDRTEGKPRQPVSLTVERREQLEQAIEGIMRDAEAAGSPCTREEAIATLASFMPEVSELLH